MSETAETQPSAGDSLRDVLERAYDAAEAAETDQAPDRDRDDRGRFAAKAEGDEAPAVETPEPPAEPEAPVIERPAAWAAERWDRLSPEDRAYVAQREQAIHSELESRATVAQEVERFKAVAAPHADRFRSMGLTEAQAFERLLAWEQALRTNPHVALPQIAQAFGLDLRNFVPDSNAPMPPTPQVLHDPRLDAMLAQQAAEKQRQEAQEAARVDAEIASFRAAPENKHFDRVRGKMASLMQFNPQLTLRDAYDAAVWADKELREERLQARLKAETEAQRKAEAARVQQARSRAVSVRDSHGTQPSMSDTTPKSLRAALEDAVNQVW